MQAKTALMICTLARVYVAGRKVSIITSEMYVVGLLGESVRFSVPDAASGDR
jgi:hypothetical protein